MKPILILFATVWFVSVCSVRAEARFVRIWTHDALTEAAQVIVIATVIKDRDVAGFDYKNAKAGAWVPVDSVFQVETVLKGEISGKTFILRHTQYSENEGRFIILDGPNFVQFDSQKKATYLLYLLRDKNNVYIPVSDQIDSMYSCYELRQPAANHPNYH